MLPTAADPASARRLASLLAPLAGVERARPRLEAAIAGGFEEAGRRYSIPRYRFRGAAVNGMPLIRLGLFAGIHGDEPAGAEALVRLLQALALEADIAAGYELVMYPVCNPTGYEDGTRSTRSGFDLNREFWRESGLPEARILERELRRECFDGIVALHADDTCEGLYGYAHGSTLNETLLAPALAVAERFLPRDARGLIDGFAAVDGVIGQCFPGVLAAPPDQQPRPFDIIFETPALAPLPLQVEATVAALHAILTGYRSFIAQAEAI